MDKNPQKPRRKDPKKISARYLENAALYYLGRYATSSANLRRVLGRKIDKSCKFHGTDAAEFMPLVDALITRYEASGLLNDKGFAEARVSSLSRQGRSKQAVTTKLTVQGLGRDDIENALGDWDADREMTAAVTMARKKKIGRFSDKPDRDADQKRKELAQMARAGFSFDTAKRALDYTADEDD